MSNSNYISNIIVNFNEIELIKSCPQICLMLGITEVDTTEITEILHKRIT